MNTALVGALEENILTLLVWSETHAPQLAMRLLPTLFSTRAYRDIAEKALDHITRYSLPPRGHLRDLCEAQLRKGDEGKLLKITLDAMEALQAELQAAYVMEELDRFIALRQMSMAVEAAADALHGGDLEAAREALYAQQPAVAMTPGIYLADPKQSLTFLDEHEEDLFPSGIELLDDMGVRPERKALTLLVAPAKRGKTWYLVNVGRAAMLGGKRVLHVTLEVREERVAKRYVQSLYAMTSKQMATIRVPVFKRDEAGRCSSIDFDTLTPDVLDSGARMRVARKLRKLGNRAPLKIKEFPTGTLTMAQLSAYLDWIAKTEDFKPDMLLVDYPDLMSIPADSLRVATGRLFQELRGLAVSRNMAVVAVTQGNRVSSGQKTVAANQVAEDYSKIGTADLVMTYSQTPEEKALGLARILVAASRNSEDQFVVLISQSYATGQFALDSVYMHRHVESEVNRLTTGEGAEDE